MSLGYESGDEGGSCHEKKEVKIYASVSLRLCVHEGLGEFHIWFGILLDVKIQPMLRQPPPYTVNITIRVEAGGLAQCC
jgi:hypothetical protein